MVSTGTKRWSQPALKDVVRCTVAGSVDSGKSTLVACLTHGTAGQPLLDDGRGSARMAVFRHKHEIESGRTSSLSQQLLGYATDGETPHGTCGLCQVARLTAAALLWAPAVMRHACCCRRTFSEAVLLTNPPGTLTRHASCHPRCAGAVLNYSGVAALTPAEVSQAAAHVLRFIDLGGHERYLKTALYGERPGGCVRRQTQALQTDESGSSASCVRAEECRPLIWFNYVFR